MVCVRSLSKDMAQPADIQERTKTFALWSALMKKVQRLPSYLVAALCFGIFISGCATVPEQLYRNPTLSLEFTETTSLGKLCGGYTSEHADLSGFSLLNEGRSAFFARTSLADLAERSLDVQYFIWERDMTGSILTEHLIEAAKRGVRVRLLIDDFNAGGHGFSLRALNACPNVEVRLYNPFRQHLMTKLGRTVELLASFARLNHRMHNKLFIADNQVALVGGRNIANAYFGAGSAYNFRDFDLFSVGPVVKDISRSFDDYWNSAWAIPAGDLYPSAPSTDDVRKAYEKLKLYIASHPEYPYRDSLGYTESLEGVSRLCNELIWGRAEVASDSPGKDKSPDSQQITSMLKEFLGNAKQQVLIVTPYLVPADPVMLREKLTDLQSKGVAVRILTNSLGSTDMVSAHVGYAKYRKLMVQCGVELYEVRPDAASRTIYTAEAEPSSVLGLHGKAALVDRSCVFIGTFNFDQRSANINTEVGLLVYSPELAQKIASAVAVDFQGQNSWRVSLASDCAPDLQPKSDQDLVWIADEEGGRSCLAKEPSGTRRLLIRSILGLLPIQSQL